MSKNRKSGSKTSGVVRLLVAAFAIVFLGYTAIQGLGFEQSGSLHDIKLGLDLAGGVSITYEAVDENPSATDMADTIYKLQLRANTYSSEAEVYQEGDNRINVDIPDVTDANAILEELGQPGSLEFQDEDGNVILTGSDVKNAEAGINQAATSDSEKYLVMLTFNDDAAQTFAEATEANVGKTISIIYDGEVVSAPTVQSAITGGQCQIEGQTSYEEAEQLASTIRIGSLKLELKEIRSNVVGAKLGSDAIETSLKAGIIGLVLVMVFMIVFYLLPGVAAALALVIYVFLMICLLSAAQITLTLPGIAGIVLSIGMAVDANVIIFSRIREELAEGKSVRMARKEGFSKALSAILDGNITTLIAAAVLYLMGTGSVKGFATTLALGTLLSMFTALVVTRFILTGFYEIGLQDPDAYGKKRAMKQFPVIGFVQKKNVFFAIALAVILCGVAGMIFNGAKGNGILNYSLEFQGGTSVSVTFNEDYSIEELNEKVIPLFSEVTGDNDIQLQKVTGSNQVIFKTKTLDMTQRETLENSLMEAYGIEQESIQEESISATVSNEMKTDAVKAVLLAAVMMLLYIWFRFKDIRIALSTVLALLHDVLVVLTCYAVFRWTVGNTFIACILTVVGYSINNTIVVFDRVREELAAQKRADSLELIINRSISQTLGRSINTSITTAIMVLALLILGVSSIREFALPLMVGICCGCFSSVCLAGSLLFIMKKGEK